MEIIWHLKHFSCQISTALIVMCLILEHVGCSRHFNDGGFSKNRKSTHVIFVARKNGKNEDYVGRTLLEVLQNAPLRSAENDESTIPITMPSKSQIPSLPSPPSESPTISLLSPSSSVSISSYEFKNYVALILFGSIGAFLLIIVSAIVLILCRSNKIARIKPWATGLSGQLQKAFVTGVPRLKKSELETACENFSNVVGSSCIGSVFKGTLSDGVEIAVISAEATSRKDWTKKSETQFREMIETLSKVNHKNFVNLIGYSKEETPFNRVMVFEYAPNGTLFEHLHVPEAEHLDWPTRIRIAMGIAYCLEYMHQLTPPIVHNNLNSSVINLTEDCASKVSYFSFCTELEPSRIDLRNTHFETPESNVYSFGLILLEMVTSKLPYCMDNGPIEEWACDYLNGNIPLVKLVDTSLEISEDGQFGKIDEVIKSCMQTCIRQRPSMKEVVARFRDISGIMPDGAIPKLSPLWWAELEIMSTQAS